jgi:flagellar assembly factor FliW
MKVATRHWGQLEVEQEALVHFPEGLLGFEQLHEFALIDAEEYRPFLWFLSTEDPDICFAVADPFYFTAAPYELSLSDNDEAALGVAPGDSLAVFIIVTFRDQERGVTGNLKGPILLNTRTRLARQNVLYGNSFSVCQPLLRRTVVPFPGQTQDITARAS